MSHTIRISKSDYFAAAACNQLPFKHGTIGQRVVVECVETGDKIERVVAGHSETTTDLLPPPSAAPSFVCMKTPADYLRTLEDGFLPGTVLPRPPGTRFVYFEGTYTMPPLLCEWAAGGLRDFSVLPMGTSVAGRNAALLLQRERAGIKKYGVALHDAGLSRTQLLQHLLEELLDAANYIQAMKVE